MAESEKTTSLASSHFPDWSAIRFVVLESEVKWAPAIGLEVAERLKNTEKRGLNVQFESCDTPRNALMFSEAANTIGLILFLPGRERDCLGLLRRLPNQTNRPAVLVVGDSVHTPLIPVMLEAGVSSVLTGVKNDMPIADWCTKLITQDC